MRPQTAFSSEAPMAQARARGVCPICTLMRAFQNSMIESPHSYPATSLCNFHAWSLAGSSPAMEAVPIFRAMLQASEIGLGPGPIEMRSCDWCSALRGHEEEKLTEFTREMKRDNFRNWVTQYGTVCVFHGRRLIKVLPEPEADVIRHILVSNQEDLEKQLMAFDVKVRRGEKGGGGLLGHIVEFLVSQRGITR